MLLDQRLSRRTLLRRTGIGLVVAGASAVLAACAAPSAPSPTSAPAKSADQAAAKGGGAPTAASQPTSAPKPAVGGKVTLQFWTNWAGRQKEVWESLMQEFHQANPTIEIVSSFMSLAEMQQKTVAAIAGGAPPDLWINAAMVRPELIVDGAVVPLDKFGKVPDDFYPASNNASVRGGQRWGLPNNGGVPVIWYHEALFQQAGLDPSKPPKTWDDLVAYGKQLTNPDKKQFGFIVPNRPYPWTTEAWYGFILQAGGDFLTPDRSAVAFNQEPGVEALKFWSDLFLVHKTSPMQTFDADSLVSTYGTGTIGMFPMYPVLTTRIKSFPFTSRNTPYPTKVKQGAHFAGNYTTIAAASKNQEAAFAWCQWWWQAEINAKWCSGTGGLPARQSTTDHPIYQKFLQEEPLAKAFIDSLAFAQALPAVVGITEIQQALSEAIEAATFGRKSPKEALDEAAAKGNDVLAKYRDKNKE